MLKLSNALLRVAHTHTALLSQCPQGVLTLKRVTACAAGKAPFTHSLIRSTRLAFQYFSVLNDPHFNQKSKISSESSIYVKKISSGSPQIWH